MAFVVIKKRIIKTKNRVAFALKTDNLNFYHRNPVSGAFVIGLFEK
jgi:hypothetical protein